MNKILGIISGLILIVCPSCDLIEKFEQRQNLDNFPDVLNDKELTSIRDVLLDSLKGKVIVFAHQSVGMNIVEGLEEIGRQSERYHLDIKFIENPSQIDGPGFYHFAVGNNHQPLTKLKHFSEFLKDAENIDIAFMKFCYVDIKDTTDVGELLNNYSTTFTALESRHPEITFVHITCPYRSEEDRLNARRNEFNKLFRGKYGANEKNLFDLALLESTKANRGRASYNLDGETYYRMHRPYTKDSGHLNAYGSYMVAKNLMLKLLALVDSK